MAINLWESAGKPTSYNPLPTGFGNSIVLPSLGSSYVVNFKAKSESKHNLLIDSTLGGINVNITLTAELKSYSIPVENKFAGNYVRIADFPNPSGDILIQDIEVVEKPMAVFNKKPKKNLFNESSAKLLTNYIANAYYSFLIPNTKPLTRYTLSHSGGSSLGKNFYWALATAPGYVAGEMLFLGHSTDTSSNSTIGGITTKSDGKLYVSIYFGIATTQAELDRFFRECGVSIQIEEGFIKTVFEPYKEVNLPAFREPAKNFLPLTEFEEGTITATGVDSPFSGKSRTRGFIPVKPNTDYIISKKAANWFAVYTYDANKVFKLKIVDENNSKKTFRTGSDEYFVRVRFDDALLLTLVNDVQLEEGTTATPYEPYKEVNRDNTQGRKFESVGDLISIPHSPILNAADSLITELSFTRTDFRNDFETLIAKRSTGCNYEVFLNVGTKAIGFYNGSAIEVFPYSPSIGEKIDLVIETNKTESKLYVNGLYKGKTNVGLGPTNTQPLNIGSFNTSERFLGLIHKVKLTIDGSVAVDFDYERKPSPKGVIMDGVTNYVSLPSMTMDSIELDCFIENRNLTYENIIDARTGLPLGYVTMSSGLLYGGHSFDITGFKHSQRTTIKASRPTPFTDDVSLLAGSTFGDKGKGVLYGVKCFLNGKVVAEYDFTKENTKANQVLFGNKTWGIKQAKR